MYTPPAFAVADDLDNLATVRDHNFGLLISAGPDGPLITHVPFLLDAESGLLTCHVAKANPHWRAIEAAGDAIAVFSGAHAYVSPRWYAGTPNVPTWNYVAVHVHGRARTVHDPEALRRLVDALAANHETARPDPWSLDELPPDFTRRQLNGIVGIEIVIDRIEGKRKLNQNKSAADRAGVVAGLRREGDADGLAVADLMARVATDLKATAK
ncbi:MAG: FMN-binding negative transcriptional regulator [Inquilinaceae bacterium]